MLKYEIKIMKYERDLKMRKKKSILLCMLCAVSVLLTACSAGGKDGVVTCDGYDLKLGKTTVAELENAGFSNDYSSLFEETNKIESMSSDTYYAKKDDLFYGLMFAVNKTASPIEFEKCVIREVTLYYDDPDYPLGEVLVNGVDFEGYTREEIKEAMGDREITMDTDTTLGFVSGDYNYIFTFADDSETLIRLWAVAGFKQK